MPSTVRDALVAIAALLAPGFPDVAERAAAAHDDPGAFVRANADRLDERGIDEPIPNLAWIALIDALDDHDLLTEIDWREEIPSTIEQLRELRSSPGPQAWQWAADADEEELDVRTEDFIRLAGRKLGESGTTLAYLDIDSDSFPLVFLVSGRAGDLVRLAATAGFRAEALT